MTDKLSLWCLALAVLSGVTSPLAHADEGMPVIVEDHHERPPPDDRDPIPPPGDRIRVAARGTLTVVTEPASRVVLDGVMIGRTPIMARPIFAGPHRLVLRTRCGDTLETFSVRPREHVRIERRGLCGRPLPNPPQPPSPAAPRGRISITARPPAEVTIDGISLGSTPIRGHYLDPGRHRVVVSARCGTHTDTRPSTVDITPGGETRLVLRLCVARRLPEPLVPPQPGRS
jgi:PEGA domain